MRRSAAQRDETIAAWEAFQREQLIASCMARAGFTYVVTAAFPEDALAHDVRTIIRSEQDGPPLRNATWPVTEVRSRAALAGRIHDHELLLSSALSLENRGRPAQERCPRRPNSVWY